MINIKINQMLAVANGENHVGEYPEGKYCPMPNKVGTIHAVCDLQEILELRAQVRQLKSELRQQKLIHIGFTNEHQVIYVTEQNEEGSFFPDSDNGCYIPVYMLDIHAHRVGGESVIYCENMRMKHELSTLPTRDAEVAKAAFIAGANYTDEVHFNGAPFCLKIGAENYANQLRQQAKGGE